MLNWFLKIAGPTSGELLDNSALRKRRGGKVFIFVIFPDLACSGFIFSISIVTLIVTC